MASPADDGKLRTLLEGARAEGSDTKYWDDPKNEAKNIAAVHDACLRAGGADMLFFVASTANRNCVVYKFNPSATKTFEYVTAEWLLLDPKTLADLPESATKDSTGNVWRPLTTLEEAYFGVSVDESVADDKTTIITISMVVAENEDLSGSMSMQLVEAPSEEGEPPQRFCAMPIGGKAARLDYSYVQMAKGHLDVEYIRVFGTRLDEPFDEISSTIEKSRATG